MAMEAEEGGTNIKEWSLVDSSFLVDPAELYILVAAKCNVVVWLLAGMLHYAIKDRNVTSFLHSMKFIGRVRWNS
jgi:hypothetical protein